MYEELVKRLRELEVITEHCDEQSCSECENKELCDKHDNKTLSGTYKETADAIKELQKLRWIPVTERLPDCFYGEEIGNVEWISHGTVYAGCFGRGGKFRDAYFRVWNDATEGIDATDAEYWRFVLLPKPPKEETE